MLEPYSSPLCSPNTGHRPRFGLSLWSLKKPLAQILSRLLAELHSLRWVFYVSVPHFLIKATLNQRLRAVRTPTASTVGLAHTEESTAAPPDTVYPIYTLPSQQQQQHSDRRGAAVVMQLVSDHTRLNPTVKSWRTSVTDISTLWQRSINCAAEATIRAAAHTWCMHQRCLWSRNKVFSCISTTALSLNRGPLKPHRLHWDLPESCPLFSHF